MIAYDLLEAEGDDLARQSRKSVRRARARGARRGMCASSATAGFASLLSRAGLARSFAASARPRAPSASKA